MPGLFGPILTTGVALSAAVVVVTNPVTAPHTDVAIPAAAVSVGTGQAVDMLDENFIKAVAPDQPESTSPFAVLKNLVSTLVADAADLGKAAVLHAFETGASVVSRPELTAASYPYLPTDTFPGPVPEDLRPVVGQALAQIVADSGDATDPDVLAAALAAGAALGTDPGALLDSLRDLIDGSVQPALDSAVSALAAAPHPEIGDAVQTAVEKYLPTMPFVENIAALPKRWDRPGAGGLVLGSNGTEAPRPHRPAVLESAVERMRSAAIERRLNAPITKTVRPEGPLSLGHFGAADGAGARRTLSNAAGAVGRAVKAHADRTTD